MRLVAFYQDVVVCKTVTKICINDRKEKFLKTSAPHLLSWAGLWGLLSDLFDRVDFYSFTKRICDSLQNLDGLHSRRLSWEQRQPVGRVGEVPAKALWLKRKKDSKMKDLTMMLVVADIKYRSCTCSAGCKFPHTLVELTTHVTELQ